MAYFYAIDTKIYASLRVYFGSHLRLQRRKIDVAKLKMLIGEGQFGPASCT